MSPLLKTTVPSLPALFFIWHPALTLARCSVERWPQPWAVSFRWARVSCCLLIWGSTWYGQTLGSVCTPRGVGLCGYCFYRLCLFLTLCCFFFLWHSFAILAAVFVKSLNKVWTAKRALWKLVTEAYAVPLEKQRLNRPWAAVTKQASSVGERRGLAMDSNWVSQLDFSKPAAHQTIGFFTSVYHSFSEVFVYTASPRKTLGGPLKHHICFAWLLSHASSPCTSTLRRLKQTHSRIRV